MSRSQKVLVAGSGISGISSAKLLLEMGGEVVLYDGNASLDPETLKKEFEEGAKVTIVLGELTRADLSGVEMCIISPGISLETPFVQMIDEARIPIWGEIQLAFQCAKGRLAAITGTNGKTTTTALTGEIMKSKFEDVYVVGNIGIPYTQVALQTEDNSVTVAEVSSFQLETIMDFRPDVSAILNITPDHLNRHHTMENYIAIKESITLNQTAKDICVLNYDDPVLREFGSPENERRKSRVIFFSSRQQLAEGYYLEGDMICYAHNGRVSEIVDTRELNLLGRHNYENVMAAIAISSSMGVSIDRIRRVVKEFKAVEHRIEFVLERSGVRYYNDSKGTNPDAAIQAVRAMPGPTLLIAGGYDKESQYDEWIESFGDKVKYLVLIGQTRDKIAECAKAHGFTEIMYAEDMSEAVRVCASYANMGDNVLLSPACASWGMFKNYEERGRIFKECVRNL
ncbi:MAG: UDP-N-acetylmuramoyl-L-alanine--D-glutamate ligase [Hungatella sp.]|jgi:UDP-N-acetylmuramoylalanine--D-glutamate ligase|nr:UDP-N-acetylmuramoyl-L-alanine--D-glutamate ligase [Hungatella sp.]MCI9502394.1 UDP-N-acetylmuramoyl-L-alanine--D-glutamate ligase [Hungatella sp.]MCI9635678.1 UDP-N-acetylmuramoyl-L-alanine--D-glutamate ligase [Hungatella sp.]